MERSRRAPPSAPLGVLCGGVGQRGAFGRDTGPLAGRGAAPAPGGCALGRDDDLVEEARYVRRKPAPLQFIELRAAEPMRVTEFLNCKRMRGRATVPSLSFLLGSDFARCAACNFRAGHCVLR